MFMLRWMNIIDWEYSGVVLDLNYISWRDHHYRYVIYARWRNIAYVRLKEAKSEEEVHYFVTLVTNVRPVFTEGKEGQLQLWQSNSWR
jgi:hypothetical protein